MQSSCWDGQVKERIETVYLHLFLKFNGSEDKRATWPESTCCPGLNQTHIFYMKGNWMHKDKEPHCYINKAKNNHLSGDQIKTIHINIFLGELIKARVNRGTTPRPSSNHLNKLLLFKGLFINAKNGWKGIFHWSNNEKAWFQFDCSASVAPL